MCIYIYVHTRICIRCIGSFFLSFMMYLYGSMVCVCTYGLTPLDHHK